ncbi:hypothetical protein GCM10023231_12720 [Olivibacter ginsenosidimutans]|uniref:Uncharacterized protein n=1 Tax=Olivibacter ginsenosidimutans TaxID=1176537 RepID=A0ABP9AWE4_9SPHI
MTTITATVHNSEDVKLLQEVLNRFGIAYTINEETEEYAFTASELKSFRDTQKAFKQGKTTAKDWNEIQKDLNRAFH